MMIVRHELSRKILSSYRVLSIGSAIRHRFLRKSTKHG